MSTHASSPWNPPNAPADGAEHIAPQAEAGETINGRYRLDREAGHTEAGVVFDATDASVGRRVAVEIASSLDEPRAQRKWARDAMLAQRLEGEHVLRVLDVGALEDHVPYVVRERAVCTLASEIAARGATSIPQAVGWTLDACEALAEAHALGMAHGDVRLENVVLARGAQELVIKVAWTSAAKAERAAREDVARDIAGLGAMLQTLATGQLGDEADGASTLPSELVHAVARSLAQDPEGRFENVAELARALAPFAPPGHSSARNVAFLMSRAGIVGSAIAAAPASVRAPITDLTPAADGADAAPHAHAHLTDPTKLTDTWFGRGARTSVLAPEPRNNRGLVFTAVSLALVGAVVAGSFFLWQTGSLPHWSGTAPTENVDTTQVTSAPAPAVVEPTEPAPPAATTDNPAPAAVPAPAAAPAAGPAPATPVEALPNVAAPVVAAPTLTRPAEPAPRAANTPAPPVPHFIDPSQTPPVPPTEPTSPDTLSVSPDPSSLPTTPAAPAPADSPATTPTAPTITPEPTP